MILRSLQVVCFKFLGPVKQWQSNLSCFESVLVGAKKRVKSSLLVFLHNQNTVKYFGDLAKMAAAVFPTFDRVASCVFQARAAAWTEGGGGAAPVLSSPPPCHNHGRLHSTSINFTLITLLLLL